MGACKPFLGRVPLPDALSCCPAPAAALANLSQVLAPGAFLLLHECLDATRALLWGLSERAWAPADARDHALWCTLERWHALLDAAGFEQVSHGSTRLCVCASRLYCYESKHACTRYTAKEPCSTTWQIW